MSNGTSVVESDHEDGFNLRNSSSFREMQSFSQAWDGKDDVFLLE